MGVAKLLAECGFDSLRIIMCCLNGPNAWNQYVQANKYAPSRLPGSQSMKANTIRGKGGQNLFYL